MAQQELEGTVDGFLFESPSSLFKIVSIKIKKADFQWDAATIVVTGNFAELNYAERYQFFGELVEHPKYGKQFKATTYQQVRPDSEATLINYLSGDQFPGIGKVAAKRIVRQLGLDAIDQILADPACLDAVGLKADQVQVLTTQLQTSHGTEQVLLALGNLGFGPQLVEKIIEKYQTDALKIIQTNPYRLALDIRQISFRQADQIAVAENIPADAPMRLQAALIQYLRHDLAVTGNTYAAARETLAGAANLLAQTRSERITDQQIADQLVQIASDGRIAVEEDRLYLTNTYLSELQIAQSIQKLRQHQVKAWPAATFKKELRALERWHQVTYNDQQVAAIEAALDQPLTILTGGPGTGKTTILNAVVTLFAKKHHFPLEIRKGEEEDFPIQLAAPTGRAAKRLAEMTDLPAKTIHRLLGLNRTDDQFEPLMGQDIHGQLLIVDEMSMVDQQLFQALLQALPSGMQVLLVGDQDQLPSVGPGRVFADLISSQEVPVTALTEIYRQSTDSTIIDLARDIKEGKVPDNLTANLPDRSFIACQPSQVAHIVDQVLLLSRQKHFSLAETQILTPMYRGVAGIDQLNASIQELVNPRKTAATKQVTVGKVNYRIGDKVIQLVNDGQRGIYNGDIGKVIGIEKASAANDNQAQLIIDFSGLEVSLARPDWINLGLAYCVSIHKSQGSEYQLVILPLTMDNRRMLQRKLLYTAVTRAKDKLVMVGQKEAFVQAILEQGTERKTTLALHIRQQFADQDQVKQPAKQGATSESMPSTKPAAAKINRKLIQLTDDEAQSNSTQTATTTSATADHVDETPVSEYRLTAKLIAGNTIDPMIGMDQVKLG